MSGRRDEPDGEAEGERSRLRDSGGQATSESVGGSAPMDEFAKRQAFFADVLADSARAARAAEAALLQTMLAGFEEMLAEEEAEAGRRLGDDDAAVRAFHLHQARVLSLSLFAVRRQLNAGRVLRTRMPKTWEVFTAGGCSLHVAGIVADQLAGVSDEHAAALDEAAADLVQRERPGLVERRLTKLREQLDAQTAIARHRTASNRRWVGARPRPDGQATLTIESTATDVAAMYDAIRTSAVAAHGLEGECRTLGQLMADCAADMILQSAAAGAIATVGEAAGPAYPMERLGDARVPGRKKIDVTLLITVPADVATGATDGLASVAGMGDVDAEVVRRIVQHTTTWTRVGVDPIDDTVFAIDTHERYIPSGLKKLIHAKNETCIGDGCGLPAHRCDLDHVTRYEHDGRTRHDNLQALCRRSHQGKDEGYVDVRLDPDGTPRWATKWGARWTTEPILKTRTASVIRWADGAGDAEDQEAVPF